MIFVQQYLLLWPCLLNKVGIDSKNTEIKYKHIYCKLQCNKFDIQQTLITFSDCYYVR
jgi:hypothetical protein